MPFERKSTKGFNYPVIADDPVATQEMATLVDVDDAYAPEQWAADLPNISGLTYAYKGGIVYDGGAYSRIADGTILLATDDTNYVERDAAGTVTVNQSGWTDTKLPMARITTDALGITAIQDWRVLDTASAASVGPHVVATTVGLGPTHTVSALSSGMVLRATGATTSAYGFLIATDIPALDAAKITSGTLTVSRGGTGVSDPTSGRILVGAGASPMTQLDFGAAGGYLRSTGATWARSALLASDLTGTTLPASIVTSSLTTVGTLVAGAVPASLVTAGTFGAGAYVFDNTVSGITTLTATTLAGTLSTAAQPNVTSLGTLTALAVSGTANFRRDTATTTNPTTTWQNLDETAATLHTILHRYQFNTTASATVTAAEWIYSKEQEWTSTGTTQDAKGSLWLAQDGSLVEVLRALGSDKSVQIFGDITQTMGQAVFGNGLIFDTNVGPRIFAQAGGNGIILQNNSGLIQLRSAGDDGLKVLHTGGVTIDNAASPNTVATLILNARGTQLAPLLSAGGVTISTASPNSLLTLSKNETITGAVTDGYAAGLRLDPGYVAASALTVTRHNYIDIQDVSLAGAGPAALTDACVLRFDAAAGTHKALTTEAVKINVNGTLQYIPFYPAGGPLVVPAITSSGIAIESGSPVITLKDTNNVLSNVAYSS
ncbi:hypothetical protein LCGC14_1591070, partial [marine sediment metagenome]